MYNRLVLCIACHLVHPSWFWNLFFILLSSSSYLPLIEQWFAVILWFVYPPNAASLDINVKKASMPSLIEIPSLSWLFSSGKLSTCLITVITPHELSPFLHPQSTLLSTLTNTQSVAASYEFTTLTCIPGVIEYKGANIQLLDLPGIIEGAAQGKGRGRQVRGHVGQTGFVGWGKKFCPFCCSCCVVLWVCGAFYSVPCKFDVECKDEDDDDGEGNTLEWT